jgi:uncharacterized protein (DUF697 family)
VAATEKLQPHLPAIYELIRELRGSAREDQPLVVAGARELAAVLRRELTRGGVAEAVREQEGVEGAAALVYVLAGEVDDEDRSALRAAERAGVPTICVVTGPVGASAPDPPFVPASNVLRVSSGSGFPVDEIARALARALGERATPVAARLPVLRRAVCEELIRRVSRQNAIVGAAPGVPGADLPVLTLNQIRLVLRIADAYGFEVDAKRVPELFGVIGSGFGFRAVARRALLYVPIAGWAVRGAVAYGGTRALGEAAVRYFERRAPVTRAAGDRARFP